MGLKKEIKSIEKIIERNLLINNQLNISKGDLFDVYKDHRNSFFRKIFNLKTDKYIIEFNKLNYILFDENDIEVLSSYCAVKVGKSIVRYSYNGAKIECKFKKKKEKMEFSIPYNLNLDLIKEF